MVASLEETKGSEPCLRLMQILEEADLPGDVKDHEWMASRLLHYADQLGQEEKSAYISDLLVAGLLLDHNIDPSSIHHLQGRTFPRDALKAVPVLLKIGCPFVSWQLIDKGVLIFEGKVWGGTDRWVLKGQLLKPFSDIWYELGDELMMKTIAKALIPLVHDADAPPQIKVTGVDRKTGRSWLRQLTSYLDCAAGGKRPHLFISE